MQDLSRVFLLPATPKLGLLACSPTDHRGQLSAAQRSTTRILGHPAVAHDLRIILVAFVQDRALLQWHTASATRHDQETDNLVIS